MDKDSDGKLTWDEFKGTRKPEELEQAEQNFKRMDTDGDKCLSLDEFKAGQKPPVKPAKKAAGKKFQPEGLKSVEVRLDTSMPLVIASGVLIPREAIHRPPSTDYTGDHSSTSCPTSTCC